MLDDCKGKEAGGAGVQPLTKKVSCGRNGSHSLGRLGCDVTLLGASAKRSRQLLDVFVDCSCAGFKLSPRDRAIIREMTETFFALNFLETGGLGRSESCEKWCAPSCPQDWHHLYFTVPHSVISDFRPASVTESGEAALRRLFARQATGGYSFASYDPAPGSLTVFQSSRVARPQDASKDLCFVSVLRSSARSSLDTGKQRMLRPVSEVVDMETPLKPPNRFG